MELTKEHIRLFELLRRDEDEGRFGLVRCCVNGEDAAAIVELVDRQGQLEENLVFVSVNDSMLISNVGGDLPPNDALAGVRPRDVAALLWPWDASDEEAQHLEKTGLLQHDARHYCWRHTDEGCDRAAEVILRTSIMVDETTGVWTLDGKPLKTELLEVLLASGGWLPVRFEVVEATQPYAVVAVNVVGTHAYLMFDRNLDRAVFRRRRHVAPD